LSVLSYDIWRRNGEVHPFWEKHSFPNMLFLFF
jgi:hypothetical protein